jgi:hypothetical protein
MNRARPPQSGSAMMNRELDKIGTALAGAGNELEAAPARQYGAG